MYLGEGCQTTPIYLPTDSGCGGSACAELQEQIDYLMDLVEELRGAIGSADNISFYTRNGNHHDVGVLPAKVK